MYNLAVNCKIISQLNLLIATRSLIVTAAETRLEEEGDDHDPQQGEKSAPHHWRGPVQDVVELTLPTPPVELSWILLKKFWIKHLQTRIVTEYLNIKLCSLV